MVHATLTLSAGVPQPDIVWYKDALPIDPVKTPRYRVLVGGSLQVNGLLPDDTGMFQCFARNLAGEVQTNTYLAVTSECSSSSSRNDSQSLLPLKYNVFQRILPPLCSRLKYLQSDGFNIYKVIHGPQGTFLHFVFVCCTGTKFYLCIISYYMVYYLVFQKYINIK